MKKNIVKILLIAAAGSAAFAGTHASASNHKIYPATAIVTEINEKTDTVYVATASGVPYEFEGIEDYVVGDLVAMIMDDNGTSKTIYDDEILVSRYVGYTELFEETLENELSK
ncbi:MAG: hypothetical protein LUG61_04910 [Lachnospiraceae bacterium]|nr:hypothetical protein [Lachnospiraceae bacterium]